MDTLLHAAVVRDAIATGDMVQVKPYLAVTASGVVFEGEHSGKIGIIAAFSSGSAVVQIRGDDGTSETFRHDIAGLALLDRRAQDRE